MRTLMLCQLVVLTLLAGCSSQPRLQLARPVLAVFPVRVVRARLPRSLRRVLQEHAEHLLNAEQIYRALPTEQLHQTLRRRRRPGCYALRCQARIGRRDLRSSKSLALRIQGSSVVAHCDVTARVYDLSDKSLDYEVHTTSGCLAEELIDATTKVLCHLSALRRTGAAKKHRSAATRAEPLCVARGELAQLEQRLQHLADKRLDEAAAGAKGLQLRRDFERFAKKGRFASLNVAALCRIGAIYEQLALRTASGKGTPETAGQRAAPYRSKAKQLYRSCLDKATQLDVSNRYTEQARRRMSLL